MDQNTAISFIVWLGEYPILFGITIFIISLLESLAIVGLIVPGMFFMLLIGAYLTTGQFSFTTAVVLTFFGAVTGDSISYFIGRYYQETLIKIWPINRYPHAFEKGVAFFKRHGNKSIILGRFIGPIRPLIPAVAGMFEMPRTQFYTSNILSALIWAPAILLPGYVIGLSFEYVNDIALRLIIFLLLVTTLVMILIWFIKICYSALSSCLNILIKTSYPYIASNQTYSDRKLFTNLLLFFLLNAIVFIIVLSTFKTLVKIDTINVFISNISISIKNIDTDGIINIIINLTNIYWLLTISIIITVFLYWKKDIILVKYFIFSLTLISIFQLTLIYVFNIDLSNNLFTLFVYIYIFFILSVNSNFIKKIFYIIVSSLVLLTLILSQIYSSSALIHELILTSFFILIWNIIITGSYQHRNIENIINEKSLTQFAIVFLISNSIYLFIMHSYDSTNITHSKTMVISDSKWKKYFWQSLSLKNSSNPDVPNQAFNLQWLDTKQNIIKQMSQLSVSQRHWQLDNQYDFKKLLQYLNPRAKINSLYIPPQIFQGEFEKLRFVLSTKTLDANNEMLVLRLWKTNIIIQKNSSKRNELPLWQGNITKIVNYIRYDIPFIKTQSISDELLIQLASDFHQNAVIKSVIKSKLILVPASEDQ